MKRMAAGAAVLALLVCGTAVLRAEEGHGGDRRRDGDGEKRKEGDGERRKEGHGEDGGGARRVELAGSFFKTDSGALGFKGGEGQFMVVAAEGAHGEIKEALKNADATLIGKGSFNVKGQAKKDSGGKYWLAIEWLGRRDGDGERRKEGDGERRKEGDGERRKEGDGERRKEGHDRK